jgi:hypothetical protein
LASSSVAAWSSARMSAGLPKMPCRPTALFVDAPHGPPAAVDGEVLPVLVDPGAEGSDRA